MQSTKRNIVTVVLSLAVMLGVTAAPTSVAADTKQACEEKFGTPKDTTKTPVILIHGLWSDKGVWLKTGMMTALSSVKNLDIVEPFDYKSANDRWVTTGDTAQRLAKTIVCFSKLYGNKDVVLVAHSKGGLLARAALDWAAYGTFAKNVTGHIVTLGTPHKGAAMAQVGNDVLSQRCNAAFVWWGDEARKNCETVIGLWSPAAMAGNSKQLAELPNFPRGISVKAIAGEVKQQLCAPWGCSKEITTNGDLIVSVESATAEYTTTGNGDGKKVFSCTDPIATPQISYPWCEHNAMLQAPQVQNEVKASIQAYLASVTPAEKPQSTKKIVVGNLEVSAPKTWELQGSDASNGDLASVIDTSTCTRTAEPDYWKLCARMTVERIGDDRKAVWDMLCSDKLLATSKSSIGGKPATLYKFGRCDAYESLGVAYLWHIPGGISVEHHLSEKAKPMTGIDDALTTASWR